MSKSDWKLARMLGGYYRKCGGHNLRLYRTIDDKWEAYCPLLMPGTILEYTGDDHEYAMCQASAKLQIAVTELYKNVIRDLTGIDP